jgi:hypothetical protein
VASGPHLRNVSLLSEWVCREERYRANSYRGAGIPDELFIAQGQAVLLTASHSIAQVRQGRRKRPDVRTGGLAELVAVESGASALTALGSGTGDPNWNADHAFKQALEELSRTHRFILDLHGIHDGYGIDVCIGSGLGGPDNRLLVEACLASAQASGLHASVDYPFAANRPWTITATAQRLGCSAAQIEIAAYRRDPLRKRTAAAELACWLIHLVQSLIRQERAEATRRSLMRLVGQSPEIGFGAISNGS